MNIPKRRKRLSDAAIYRFINRCRLEMRSCEISRAYVAGIVLCGAAVEYILAAWLRAFDVPRRAKHAKQISSHWSLKELNDLAYSDGLFDYKAYRAAERIRKWRNLVHPNWYAGRNPIKFTKHILAARLADYEAVIDSIQRYL